MAMQLLQFRIQRRIGRYWRDVTVRSDYELAVRLARAWEVDTGDEHRVTDDQGQDCAPIPYTRPTDAQFRELRYWINHSIKRASVQDALAAAAYETEQWQQEHAMASAADLLHQVSR